MNRMRHRENEIYRILLGKGISWALTYKPVVNRFGSAAKASWAIKTKRIKTDQEWEWAWIYFQMLLVSAVLEDRGLSTCIPPKNVWPRSANAFHAFRHSRMVTQHRR